MIWRRVAGVCCVGMLWPMSALAGAAPASLTCATADGRQSIKGRIPASEEALDLELASTAGTLQIVGGAHSANIVESFSDKVFTLSISGKYALVMYAIPATIKAKVGKGATFATFQAIAQAFPKPSAKNREDLMYDDYLHDLKMNCRYEYSI